MEFDFEQWGINTTAGIFAGLLYGGVKESLATSEGGMHTMLPLLQARAVDHREKRRLWREAMEQRFLRVAKGSVVGGVKLGLFAALFSGVQDGLAVHRQAQDMSNVVAAGAATAGLFGLATKGSVKSRLQTAVLGVALGAALSLPLGYVQTKLSQEYQKELAEAHAGSSRSTSSGIPEADGVERVIRRLEAGASDDTLASNKGVASGGDAAS